MKMDDLGEEANEIARYRTRENVHEEMKGLRCEGMIEEKVSSSE